MGIQLERRDGARARQIFRRLPWSRQMLSFVLITHLLVTTDEEAADEVAAHP